MSSSILKWLLPDRPVETRIWLGPFRGARILMNPRHSIRKLLGLYEHELNSWIEQALRRVSRVIDVGANDGYFTFGCIAAFRRLAKTGEVIAFEPQPQVVKELQNTIDIQSPSHVQIEIIEAFVGRENGVGMVTLDSLPANDRRNTLIKIDVEGAEVDVIAGAQSWMHKSNLFVIEVHKEEYISVLLKAFEDLGHKLIQINQRPLPFLGREARDVNNWWLTTDLSRCE